MGVRYFPKTELVCPTPHPPPAVTNNLNANLINYFFKQGYKLDHYVPKNELVCSTYYQKHFLYLFKLQEFYLKYLTSHYDIFKKPLDVYWIPF